MEIDGIADTPRTELKQRRRKNFIPRPPNSYLIFRAEKSDIFRQFIQNADPKQINGLISTMSSIWWKAMRPEEKAIYDKKADDAKLEHMKKHPDYKYTPARRNQKQLTSDYDVEDDEELAHSEPSSSATSVTDNHQVRDVVGGQVEGKSVGLVKEESVEIDLSFHPASPDTQMDTTCPTTPKRSSVSRYRPYPARAGPGVIMHPRSVPQMRNGIDPRYSPGMSDHHMPLLHHVQPNFLPTHIDTWTGPNVFTNQQGEVFHLVRSSPPSSQLTMSPYANAHPGHYSPIHASMSPSANDRRSTVRRVETGFLLHPHSAHPLPTTYSADPGIASSPQRRQDSSLPIDPRLLAPTLTSHAYAQLHRPSPN